jgi:hypothetical protein
MFVRGGSLENLCGEGEGKNRTKENEMEKFVQRGKAKENTFHIPRKKFSTRRRPEKNIPGS